MNGGSGEPSDSQALELATRLGAGRLIAGEIVGTGAHVTISISMLDVASHHSLTRETIVGSADSLAPLLDRVSVRLLAIGAGQDVERLASLTGTSLPAVRAYLNGEVLDRLGHYDSAEKSFQEALRSDSTFALAAMRLARTSPWPDVERAARETAWRHRDQLSVPDRAELTVLLGPRYPAPSYYRETIAAAEHLVQLAPQDPWAWIQLGLTLFNEGPLLALPEAHARAAAAFARAVALDSTSAVAQGQLSIAAATLGDIVTARKALAQLRRQQQDSTSRADFEPAWFLAAVTADTAALHRVLRTDSTNGPGGDGGSGAAMIRLALHQGLSLQDADGVLERELTAAATEDQRAGIRWGQMMLDGIRGRSGQRPRGLPAVVFKAPDSGPILNFLFTDGDSAGWDKAGAALLRQIGSRRVDQCCIPRFAAGEYALATNRLDLAERAATDLRAYHGAALDADSALATPISHQYGMILEAQIAARRHDPSAAARLRQVDSLLADPLDSWTASLGNLVAAQLHEARGELGAALAAVRRRDWDEVIPYYLVYHREEGRLAALTGDTAAAILAYHRYLALRSDAEPGLQPRVQAIRAALAALEHGKAGH
jgi:tetratricopeptide (TPR) repeat protein